MNSFIYVILQGMYSIDYTGSCCEVKASASASSRPDLFPGVDCMDCYKMGKRLVYHPTDPELADQICSRTRTGEKLDTMRTQCMLKILRPVMCCNILTFCLAGELWKYFTKIQFLNVT